MAQHPVHVLIRPRAGHFDYTEREPAVMRRDIEAAKAPAPPASSWASWMPRAMSPSIRSPR